MPRKSNNWLTMAKYNLRRNYHYYNLRSAPLVIRRPPSLPRRAIVRRRVNRINLEPRHSVDDLSINSSPDVGIVNVNSTLHSSVSEVNSSDDTVSEEFQPEMLRGFPIYSRQRFPFSISQPVNNRYRSPRAFDYLAGGDGQFNNMLAFQLVMGPENEHEHWNNDIQDEDPDHFNEGDYGE